MPLQEGEWIKTIRYGSIQSGLLCRMTIETNLMNVHGPWAHHLSACSPATNSVEIPSDVDFEEFISSKLLLRGENIIGFQP